MMLEKGILEVAGVTSERAWVTSEEVGMASSDQVVHGQWFPHMELVGHRE